MFNKNKRTKKVSDLLIPGIILIIIGIVFAFQGIRDYSKLNGDLLNLNTASEKDLEAGKYVEIDVDYAFYSFCENVETTNYVFKRTTEQYYLISALEDNEYYIGLNIAESKKSELENLSDYTWSQSDVNPGTLHYIGKLCKSDSEIMGYMRNYIHDMYESAYNITLTSTEKATLDSYMLPYYIKIMTKEGCRTSIIIGLVVLGLGILLIILGIIRHKNTVYGPDIQSEPYTGAYGNPTTPDMNTGMNSGYADPNAQTGNMNDTFSPYGGTPTPNGPLQYEDQTSNNTNTDAQEPTTPFSDSNTSEATTSGLDPDTFGGNGNSSFKLKD